MICDLKTIFPCGIPAWIQNMKYNTDKFTEKIQDSSDAVVSEAYFSLFYVSDTGHIYWLLNMSFTTYLANFGKRNRHSWCTQKTLYFVTHQKATWYVIFLYFWHCSLDVNETWRSSTNINAMHLMFIFMLKLLWYPEATINNTPKKGCSKCSVTFLPAHHYIFSL